MPFDCSWDSILGPRLLQFLFIAFLLLILTLSNLDYILLTMNTRVLSKLKIIYVYNVPKKKGMETTLLIFWFEDKIEHATPAP